MKKFRWLLALFVAVAAVPAALAAQAPTTVTGTVTSAETGEPLPGITVMVEGTGVGTLTDAQGRYSIEVPAGSNTLNFTSLAYGDETVEITGSVVNVALESEAIALEGVVVTALGIEQQERAISTSVAELDSEEFTDAPEPNLVNALAGEVAGVQTIGAGPQGGSARIVIRGASSISGNNQPLFVIDGVPISNDAPNIQGYGGIDYGNAASDINSSDIASVTVLKGPNAAALYGSRAANGVILITTKNGSGIDGTQVTVQSNTSFTEPLRLPDYQNQYGQGYGGEFSFGTINTGADESWGPPCDGRPVVQWWSEGEAVPFECHPDNVEGFFETGLSTYNSVALASSSDQANARISLSNENIDGMYPGFEQNKWNVSLSGALDISDRFRGDASVNYVRKEGEQRPGIGYDFNNFMQQTVWFGRSVDIDRLREAYFASPDVMNTWNPAFHTNPYWLQLKNTNWDDRDRIIGNASLSYDLADWLTTTARVGTDWYQDERKQEWWEDGTNNFYSGFVHDNINTSETNVDLLLSANRDLTESVTLNATVGGNHRYSEYSSNRAIVDELTVPGIFSVGNSARPVRTGDYREQLAMNSLYGQAQFGYNNYAFVQVTGRNDWSSTLPEENNSYFYPSVSGSFIFTDAFDLNSDFLTFGKLRASWAQVGNDAQPYQLFATYPAQPSFNGNIPAFAVPDELANADLKPEQTESWEIGTNLQFFDNRLGLEATYYDMVTRDQILATQISGTTGFYSQVVNAGAIANKGFELRLNATPVALDNGFTWDMAVNYANNNSEILELAEGLDTYVLGQYWQVTTEAKVGDAYGGLYGIGFQRDEQGRRIIGANGLPLGTDERILLGNYTPDWTGSLSNTFGYNGLELSFLLDSRQGGELYSVTQAFGLYTGVLEETLKGREESFGTDADGNYICEPGLVLDGVTESGEPNEVNVCPNQYYKYLFGSGIREAAVYDASYVKLREARLGYTLPQSIMERTPFSNMSIALVGRNLMLWTDMPNIDPETAFDAGNSQGFEFGQIPTARSIGFNIIVTP